MPDPQYLSTDPTAGMPMRPAAPPSGFRAFVSPSQEAREKGLKTDYGREDNSLLGLPPEAAVVPGLGVGRAVAGASGLVNRGIAGATALGEGVILPYAKYSATKHLLLSLGVPSPVAEAMAVIASGYRRGVRPSAPSEPAPVVSPASPVASSPAVPVPEVAPGVPARPAVQSVTRGLSPQRIQNELGIQARRQKVTLSEPQYKAATDLVSQGKSPAEAVTDVARRTASTPPPAVATPEAAAPPKKTPKAPARAKLTADEADEYLRLTGTGASHEEAVEALMQQRQLAKKLGTPSPESVRRRVAERNIRGKWPKN